MNDKHYHIDVTPEEELMFNMKKTPKNSDIKIKEPRTFMVTGAVIIVHVICAACVLGFSSSNAAQKQDEDKNKSEEIQSIAKKQDGVPVDDKPTKNSFPQPSELSPRNKIAAPPKLFPKPTQIAPLVPKVEPRPAKPSQNKLVSTYVVKSGDTVYSIAKKYRLVTARLLEINGIKDPKQLKVGQILKFM